MLSMSSGPDLFRPVPTFPDLTFPLNGNVPSVPTFPDVSKRHFGPLMDRMSPVFGPGRFVALLNNLTQVSCRNSSSWKDGRGAHTHLRT
jgi:hypothetical protein